MGPVKNTKAKLKKRIWEIPRSGLTIVDEAIVWGFNSP